MAGIVILSLVVVMAVAAPLLAPADPTDMSLLDRLKPPGFVDSDGHVHYLGTDQLGRDLLSRLIYGARVSLSVAFIGPLISLIVGVVGNIRYNWYEGQEATVLYVPYRQAARQIMQFALRVPVNPLAGAEFG